MFALFVFVVALLLVAACGGSGVVLQQFLHVVERPLEFSTPGRVDVEPVPVPEPAEPEPVVDPTPAVEPEPRPAIPKGPRPTVPRDPPPPSEPEPTVEPRPSTDPPAPTEPEPEPVRAEIRVTGDAERVRVVGGGQDRDLPGFLPPGRYDVEVQFPGGTPFLATSLLVMDEQTLTVACRQALGICTVR